MTDTLAYLRGRRAWLVRDFSVWGALSAYDFSFLLSEDDSASQRLLFLNVPLGGDLQRVSYDELTDIHGNTLPATITNPKVAVFPKDAVGAVVTGRENSESFTIAKISEKASASVCDLLIFEMG